MRDRIPLKEFFHHGHLFTDHQAVAAALGKFTLNIALVVHKLYDDNSLGLLCLCYPQARQRVKGEAALLCRQSRYLGQVPEVQVLLSSGGGCMQLLQAVAGCEHIALHA